MLSSVAVSACFLWLILPYVCKLGRSGFLPIPQTPEHSLVHIQSWSDTVTSVQRIVSWLPEVASPTWYGSIERSRISPLTSSRGWYFIMAQR